MEQIAQIYQILNELLASHCPPLEPRKVTDTSVEYAGTTSVMQGKQKVDGHYFATLMIKPKDVRFYFFPIYTHASDYTGISAELRKFLKGKSCFHIKKLDEGLVTELTELIAQGVKLYKSDGLI